MSDSIKKEDFDVRIYATRTGNLLLLSVECLKQGEVLGTVKWELFEENSFDSAKRITEIEEIPVSPRFFVSAQLSIPDVLAKKLRPQMRVALRISSNDVLIYENPSFEIASFAVL